MLNKKYNPGKFKVKKKISVTTGKKCLLAKTKKSGIIDPAESFNTSGTV